MTMIETDYLVVGAGAVGMAFADALIAETDVDVVLVDRQHRPGGHWTNGYPFLRLHQPSAYYGVNSRALGADSIDITGPNAGFYERATVAEVCDYYRRVLEEMLASGGVRFFGGCDYVGDWSSHHAFRSRLTGNSTTVRVRRKIVDATYIQSSVPGTHTPGFEVDPAARVIPVGRLADLPDAPSGFTILGAGKTAMDACCWLLDNGVDPDRIRWIKPREAWIFDRARVQPLDLIVPTIEGLSLGIEALAEAPSPRDLFGRLEACESLVRIDRTVEPTMFKGAVLSQAEREALRQISRVVRLGRVKRIGRKRLVLEDGEIPVDRGEVHVDCTADGLPVAPPRPIFEPGRITIQTTGGLTCLSAATVAYVEAARDEDAERNRLCPPKPHPNHATDWITFVAGIVRGAAAKATEPDLAAWLERSRLSLFRGMADRMTDARMQAAMARWTANAEAAIENAERLMAASTASNPHAPGQRVGV